jgi:hypothetical protein
MPIAVATGMVDDSDILANEKRIDMDDVIPFLDPDVSQFTTMLQRVKSQKARATKVEWMEDELFPRLSSNTGGATNVATTFTVAVGEGAFFRSGDIVRVSRTGEALRIVTMSGDTVSVCIRGIGSTAAAAITAGDQLVIVGNASAQGAGLGTRKITKRVPQYNYQQIQRNPYGFTNSLIETDLYTEGEPEHERSKKAIEHKRALEQLLFFGARAIDVTGTEPIGYSGGLVEYITTNVKNPAGALTSTLLDTYFRDFLAHGSQNKVMFCAPVVAQAISGFLLNAWKPASVSDRLWGAKVDGYISGVYGWEVPVVVKRDWNDFSTTSTQYGSYAFVVDMDYVKMRPLRNTRLLRGRQANDADSYDEELLTEFSFELQHERCHGVIKGVTG